MTTIDNYMENMDDDPNQKNNFNLQLCLKSNIVVNRKDFMELFKTTFKEIWKKELILDDESEKFLHTIMCYFYRRECFFRSPYLRKDFNEPSFEKGLLIIGNPGLGKSAFLKTFEVIFRIKCHTNMNFYFLFSDVNDVICEFESLQTYQKEEFYQTQSKGFRCYDDIKSERQASNFGISNLMQDILHSRYNSRQKTILITNFNDKYPNDCEKALDELGEKYGSRIYDRIFEMFNIIVVKGTSKRN